ncbi:hypothetical protein I7I53_04231 [Histoplasma capsulatum var. duboisii H88]|uniref:Protein kinase domain-containing protein n=1 Tax=Ajellomyces capsulatus (strain H88) TaxID=544711 RepID=A0A8A1LQN8_AJEC8|nr:hypothetical protein I7I53_04231 [Histoplasma capsulatum var. duboisii H88]
MSGKPIDITHDTVDHGASVSAQRIDCEEQAVAPAGLHVKDIPKKLYVNEYEIGKMIDVGSHSNIYTGTHTVSRQEVAVKIQHDNIGQLQHESRVYTHLSGGVGIPSIHWFGMPTTGFQAMVIDLLGPTLEDLFTFCGRKFTLKTVLLLADQLICCLESIHTKSFIHCDVNPGNFLMGTGNCGNQVHVIDFELAKEYQCQKTGLHIQAYETPKSFIGTACYASINAHLGLEQSRRDDIESLGYVLLYFLRGNLPWQDLSAATEEEKHNLILKMKQDISISQLCFGLPSAFSTFIEHSRSLSFEQKPDYSYLRKIFRDLFAAKSFDHDCIFDWTNLKV